MFKQLRMVGVVGCVISTAMMIGGALTDHWVNSDNGHWGLWEICDNSLHKNSTNATDMLTTTTPTPFLDPGLGRFSTSKPIKPVEDGKKDKKDKDGDDDEDDDSCMPLGISSIPAFLHIVRGLMVVTVLVLGWGLLSSRSLQMRVIRGDTFFEKHKSEILGCFACAGTVLAVFMFNENYKSVFEDKFINSYLDWSYYFVRFSLFVYFPAAVLMMSPSLNEKCENCSLSNFCVSKQENRSRPRPAVSSLRNINLEFVRRHSAPHEYVRDGDRNLNAALPEEEEEIIDGFQMSETDSDIFTVTFENGSGGNVQPSAASDLPQYEDVAGTGGGSVGGIPPPPSYDDVMFGGYLSFAPSSTTSPPAPLAPPMSLLPPAISSSSSGSGSETSSGSSNYTSYGSRTELPPPAYESRDSSV